MLARSLLLIVVLLTMVWFTYNQFLKPPPPPPPPPAIETPRPPIRILNPQEIEQLVESTRDLDPNVRWEAVKLLNELQAPQAMPTLYEMLTNDSDAGLRKNVLTLLEKRGGPENTEHIVRALNDSETDVRIAALQALAKIGDPGESSVASAVSACLKDSDEKVRLQAIKALDALRKKAQEKNAQEEALRRQPEQSGG